MVSGVLGVGILRRISSKNFKRNEIGVTDRFRHVIGSSDWLILMSVLVGADHPTRLLETNARWWPRNLLRWGWA
jgi:hypothetical protein